jgi:hypothetical protein
MQHPDEGLIHTWLDGELSDEQAASFETHIAECADRRVIANRNRARPCTGGSDPWGGAKAKIVVSEHPAQGSGGSNDRSGCLSSRNAESRQVGDGSCNEHGCATAR